MKVCVVNHSSARDHLGGAERSLLALLDRWVEVDPTVEIEVISKSPPGLVVSAANTRGWPVTTIPFQGWLTPAPFDGPVERAMHDRLELRAAQAFLQAIERSQPDLVISNTIVVPWGAVAAAYHGIPHVWFPREFGDLDHGMHFVHGRSQTLRDIVALSDLVVANSRAVAGMFETTEHASNIEIAYPPVDVTAIRAHAVAVGAARAPDPDANLTVTVVGRLTPTKGQWRVVEAVGILRERGHRVHVNFVGGVVHADHDRQLRVRAAELGVASYITMHGELSDPVPWILAADVCVTPSSREAFGRTTLEYLALGRPVIATTPGGADEIVQEGRCGFLVDPDDISQLADRLERYIREPGLLRDHSEAASDCADDVIRRGLPLDDVIARLGSMRTRHAPVLPATTRDWLGVGERIVGAHPRGLLTARFHARRWGRRLGRALSDPVGVLRRRFTGTSRRGAT